MQKRYWLQFGKIFLGISVLLLLINLGCGTATGGLESFRCIAFFVPLAGILLPFGSLIDGLQIPEPQETYLVMIFAVLVWTILGALLGWLYGKIKNRSVHNS